MSLPDCRLYLITPSRLDDLTGFAALLAQTLDAGDVAALQIRLKDVSDEVIAEAVAALTPIAQARGVAVILNDRPDLAARLGCDGVHVGQSDMSCKEARRFMGPDLMVGVTCHDSRHLAIGGVTLDNAAGLAAAGADFLAVSAGVWAHPSGPAAAIQGLNAAIAVGLAQRAAPPALP